MIDLDANVERDWPKARWAVADDWMPRYVMGVDYADATMPDPDVMIGGEG